MTLNTVLQKHIFQHIYSYKLTNATAERGQQEETNCLFVLEDSLCSSH